MRRIAFGWLLCGCTTGDSSPADTDSPPTDTADSSDSTVDTDMETDSTDTDAYTDTGIPFEPKQWVIGLAEPLQGAPLPFAVDVLSASPAPIALPVLPPETAVTLQVAAHPTLPVHYQLLQVWVQGGFTVRIDRVDNATGDRTTVEENCWMDGVGTNLAMDTAGEFLFFHPPGEGALAAIPLDDEGYPSGAGASVPGVFEANLDDAFLGYTALVEPTFDAAPTGYFTSVVGYDGESTGLGREGARCRFSVSGQDIPDLYCSSVVDEEAVIGKLSFSGYTSTFLSVTDLPEAIAPEGYTPSGLSSPLYFSNVGTLLNVGLRFEDSEEAVCQLPGMIDDIGDWHDLSAGVGALFGDVPSDSPCTAYPLKRVHWSRGSFDMGLSD